MKPRWNRCLFGALLAAGVVQLAVLGVAQAQKFRTIPEGSVGKVRIAVSLAMSRKLAAPNAQTLSATIKRISVHAAAALIKSKLTSLSKRWAPALDTALQSDGTTAALVTVKGEQLLAVAWKPGALVKHGVRANGVLIDLRLKDGGLSDNVRKTGGIDKGKLGPMCSGCSWVWPEVTCAPCAETLPKETSIDFQPLVSLPQDKKTSLLLFILPKSQLALRCADEPTTVALHAD